MLLLLAALALAAPVRAHTLSVVYAKGSQSFRRSISVMAGAQANETSKVSGRDMIVNAVLQEYNGRVGVELQTELSKKGEAGMDTVQFQTSLEFTPGMSLVALKCDGWSITVGVDAKGEPTDAPWAAGLDDARLTLIRGKERCSRVARLGNQVSFTHGIMTAQGHFNLILNDVLASNEDPAHPGYLLEYQLEDTRRGGRLQKQNRLILTPGAQAADGPAAFLLEAQSGPNKAPAAAQQQAAPKQEPEHGTVQLLR